MFNSFDRERKTSGFPGRLMATCAVGTFLIAFLSACQDASITGPEDPKAALVVQVDDGTLPLPNGMPDFTLSEGEIGQSEVETDSVSAPVPNTTKNAHGGPILP